MQTKKVNVLGIASQNIKLPMRITKWNKAQVTTVGDSSY